MKILKIGHRGARLYEPENTLRSFAAAVRLGVDYAEFDVRFSLEKIPVVIHDETVDRTTRGRGRVGRLTLPALRRLDAGRGEKIPTLEEALRFLRDHRTGALVELKEKHGVDRVVRAVEKSGARSILISFYPEVLKEIAHLNPELPTGLIFSNPIRKRAGFFRLAKTCRARWLLGHIRALSRPFVDTAHRLGFQVEAWVANDRRAVRRLSAMGVDAIASDKPDLLQGV